MIPPFMIAVCFLFWQDTTTALDLFSPSVVLFTAFPEIGCNIHQYKIEGLSPHHPVSPKVHRNFYSSFELYSKSLITALLPP